MPKTRRNDLKRCIFCGALLALASPAVASPQDDMALAKTVRAAPDAVTLKCTAQSDIDYVTVSRQMHAVVVRNTLVPDAVEVDMSGVPTGNGEASTVEFGEDSISWSKDSPLGQVEARLDRSTLSMTVQYPFFGERFSCIKVSDRKQL